MKAIFSKINLTNEDHTLVCEYLECVKDIINCDDVKSLNDFVQHCNTNRFQHSLNVSYYGFLWARKMNFDYKSVARAGLLHDLYLYDWKLVKSTEHHAFLHPKEALKNAMKITTINKIESDAIVNHMWPISKNIPRYKESYILNLADKYTTILEVTTQIYKFAKISTLSKLAFK